MTSNLDLNPTFYNQLHSVNRLSPQSFSDLNLNLIRHKELYLAFPKLSVDYKNHHERRQKIISTLILLFEFPLSQPEGDLPRMISSYTLDLIKSDLLDDIMKLLHRQLGDLSGEGVGSGRKEPDVHGEQRAEESGELTKLVLLSFIRGGWTQVHLTTLFTLYHYASSVYTSALSFPWASLLNNICCLLLLTIIQALGLREEILAPPTPSLKSSLSSSPTSLTLPSGVELKDPILENITDELLNSWGEGPSFKPSSTLSQPEILHSLNGVALFSWALFLHVNNKKKDKVPSLLDKAICKKKAFRYFASIVLQLDKNYTEGIIPVCLGSSIWGLLKHYLLYSQLFPLTSRPESDFEDLLILFAVLFRNRSELIEDFWRCRGGRLLTEEIFNAKTEFIVRVFVPYLKFWTALATSSNPIHADKVYERFRSDEKFLSWNYFFLTFTKYIRELDSAVSGVQKSINPEDVEPLATVVELLEKVVYHSPSKRKEILLHPSWKPLNTLFALFCSPVDPLIKAKALNALAAFSRTDEIAQYIWLSLEACQIIPTLPTSAQAFKSDLEAGDSNPQTEAFLQLFLQLVSCGGSEHFIENLGREQRDGGAFPYLHFMLDSLFLKQLPRSTKDIQPWKNTELLCKIFLKVLRAGRVESGLVVAKMQSTQVKFLSYFLLQTANSPLNKLLNFVADKLLQTVLFQQRGDLDFLNQYESVLLSALELLEEVIKTVEGGEWEGGRGEWVHSVLMIPNFMNSLIQLFSYGMNDKISLYTIRIVRHCQKHEALVKLMLQDDLRGYFSRALDPRNDTYYGENYVEESPRYALIDLLIEDLKTGVGSVNQWLLGGGTTMTDGAEGGDFLTTLVEIIDEGASKGQEWVSSPPPLLESISELLFLLSQYPSTSSTVMSFLRTPFFQQDEDFFFRFLAQLPLPLSEFPSYQINLQAHFLMTLAMEIHLTQLVPRQRKHLKKCFDLLFSPLPNHSFHFSGDHRPKIIQLMEVVERVKIRDVDVASLGLETSLIESVLQQCLKPSSSQFLHIPSIPSHLIPILPQNIPQNNQDHIVKTIVEYGIVYNEKQRLETAKFNLSSALKQLLEIVFLKAFEYFRKENMELVYRVVSVLLDQIDRVQNDKYVEAISSSLLTIFAQLRSNKSSETPSSVEQSGLEETRIPRELAFKALRKIADAIKAQKSSPVRGNLYSALICFIKLVESQKKKAPEPDKWWDVKDEEDSFSSDFRDEVVKTISLLSFDRIFFDALNSPGYVWRSLAFSLLNTLILYDEKNHIAITMKQQGFLKLILKSLSDPNENQLLNPNALDFSYYIAYHSMMSLLCKLGQSVRGAEVVWEQGFLRELVRSQSLENYDQKDTGTINKFLQVLEPSLRVLEVVFRSLSKSEEAAHRTMEFLHRKWGLVCWLMKDQHFASYHSLSCLLHLTSIFQKLFTQHIEVLQKWEGRGSGFSITKVCEWLQTLLITYYNYVPAASTSTPILPYNGRSYKQFYLTPGEQVDLVKYNILALRLVQTILSFFRPPIKSKIFFQTFNPISGKINSLEHIVDVYKYSQQTLESGPKYEPTLFIIESCAVILWKHLEHISESDSEQLDSHTLDKIKTTFETSPTHNSAYLDYLVCKIKQFCERQKDKWYLPSNSVKMIV